MTKRNDAPNTPVLRLAHGYVIEHPTPREQIYWRSGMLYAKAIYCRHRAYNIARYNAVATETRFNHFIRNLPPNPQALLSHASFTTTNGLLLLTEITRKTTKPAQHLVNHLLYLYLPENNDRTIPPDN